MSVDSSPDLDKILYRSMSVDSSPDFDKISTCDPIFRKNGYVKSQWEKIFEFEIFVLKYVLTHSESIPTKNFSNRISLRSGSDYLILAASDSDSG